MYFHVVTILCWHSSHCCCHTQLLRIRCMYCMHRGLKSIVSLYRAHVLLFFKHLKSTAKRDEYGRHVHASANGINHAASHAHSQLLIPTRLRWRISPRNEGYTSKREVSRPFCILQYTREVDFTIANAKVHAQSRAQG